MLKIFELKIFEMIDIALSISGNSMAGPDLIASLRRRLYGEKVAKLLVLGEK
jgi:hypothetical protein